MRVNPRVFVRPAFAGVWFAVAVVSSGCTRTATHFSAQAPAPRQDTSRTLAFQLTSRVFNNTRTIRVHLPAGYDDASNVTRRYPVLYMNDGFATFSARAWNAPGLVDSLIAAGRVVPLILVGVDNAASISGSSTPVRDRANEYLPYPDATEPELPAPAGARYPEFLTDEVIPFVASRFRVTTNAAETAIGGASYGGIAALYAVLRRPGRFGGLLLESTPAFLFNRRLLTESAALETWPRSVYIGLGTRETDDLEMATAGERALVDLAATIRTRSPQSQVRINKVEGANHTSAAWRSRFPTALTSLFGIK